MKLSIDIETYSSVDIKKAGMYKYVESQDFEVLLFAYSVDGGPVQIVDFTKGEVIPIDIYSMLYKAEVEKHAYNAAFECVALAKHFGVDPSMWVSQWCCTMLHGAYLGYPLGLGKISEVLELGEDKTKMKVGKQLINYFCKPCKPTKKNGGRTRNLSHHEPEKWELFKEYCKQDVIAEMAVKDTFSNFPIPYDVQRQWVLDTRINMRGAKVDTRLVEGALYCDQLASEKLTDKAKLITGLSNPNSVAQLSAWIEEQTGKPIPNLQKATVKSIIEETDNLRVKEVLKIRQKLGKTSVSKYAAMRESVCTDDRIRGLIMPYGANRTGRAAGRLVQIQNLPRNYLDTLNFAREQTIRGREDILSFVYGNVPDTLSQLIRTSFIAEEGYRLGVADFSSIEARVLAWLAGEKWILNVFADHGKIYEATASQMFGIPIELIKKGNLEYEYRQKGKVATLALGYQGGKNALIAMGALNSGIEESELDDIVSRWRNANPNIKQFWHDVENAAVRAVETGISSTVGYVKIALEGDGKIKFLTIELPSGRKLYYPEPWLQENKFGKNAVHFWGLNQTNKKWSEQSTYGGKLVENITQAVARDCLYYTLEKFSSLGYLIVFHVHDEIIIETRDISIDGFCSIMSEPIPWAQGLPLNADGFISEYYKKD